RLASRRSKELRSKLERFVLISFARNMLGLAVTPQNGFSWSLPMLRSCAEVRPTTLSSVAPAVQRPPLTSTERQSSAALVRLALVRSVPTADAPHRFAPVRFAPTSFVPLRLRKRRFALVRLAFVKFAPLKFCAYR